MDGGYDSEGKYVKKGAATKVNPPMPLEAFDKSRAAKFPPGPWLSGYVLESEGMHEKTKPVKYQPGPWKDDYNFPVEDPPDLKPPRKPGDAVSYVIQGQEKVEARKAAETNVPRKEIKPLKKTTKLTARYQLPLHDMNITQKVDPTPQQITESVNVKSPGIREWSQKEGPGSKETKVLDWKDPFGVNRKIFLSNTLKTGAIIGLAVLGALGILAVPFDVAHAYTTKVGPRQKEGGRRRDYSNLMAEGKKKVTPYDKTKKWAKGVWAWIDKPPAQPLSHRIR